MYMEADENGVLNQFKKGMNLVVKELKVNNNHYEIKTNRHHNTDGSSWGWVEKNRGTIFYWSNGNRNLPSEKQVENWFTTTNIDMLEKEKNKQMK